MPVVCAGMLRGLDQVKQRQQPNSGHRCWCDQCRPCALMMGHRCRPVGACLVEPHAGNHKDPLPTNNHRFFITLDRLFHRSPRQRAQNADKHGADICRRPGRPSFSPANNMSLHRPETCPRVQNTDLVESPEQVRPMVFELREGQLTRTHAEGTCPTTTTTKIQSFPWLLQVLYQQYWQPPRYVSSFGTHLGPIALAHRRHSTCSLAQADLKNGKKHLTTTVLLGSRRGSLARPWGAPSAFVRQSTYWLVGATCIFACCTSEQTRCFPLLFCC